MSIDIVKVPDLQKTYITLNIYTRLILVHGANLALFFLLINKVVSFFKIAHTDYSQAILIIHIFPLSLNIVKRSGRVIITEWYLNHIKYYQGIALI